VVPRLRWFFANLVEVKLSQDASGGQMSVVELVGPPGDMPPLHLHRTDDEAWYDHAVGEVVLLGVAAQIGERQHRDRRLVGQGQLRSRSSFRGTDNSSLAGIRCLASERPEVPLARDAFELLQASIAEIEA
jgi:hypothetical protein